MYEKIEQITGKKGTFVVNIHYCKNSTWQGSVVWAEKNRREYFRSALELVKLIDNALDTPGEETAESFGDERKKA